MCVCVLSKFDLSVWDNDRFIAGAVIIFVVAVIDVIVSVAVIDVVVVAGAVIEVVVVVVGAVIKVAVIDVLQYDFFLLSLLLWWY